MARDGGLIIEVLERVGEENGRQHDEIAVKGRQLDVLYTGSLLETGRVFSSVTGDDTPFRFVLGVGDVIKGWDEGLEGMRIGEKRRLTIPPDMGYGHLGLWYKSATTGETDVLVPRDAWVVYDVELVDVGVPPIKQGET